MKVVAKTDIGNQRTENQDNYRAGRQADGTVWALVCDGMGGAQGGKIASAMATECMEHAFAATIDTLRTPKEIRKFMLKTVDAACEQVYKKSQSDEALTGMGTTVVCIVLRDGLLQYVHAGDSRAYLYHAGLLRQLTTDHSMVQELLEHGRITPEEAYNHPNKNLITRAVGVAEHVNSDYGEVSVSPEDMVLLCTDGLTNYVSDEDISGILSQTPFEQLADTLIARALATEGLDNVTVLLVKGEA